MELVATALLSGASVLRLWCVKESPGKADDSIRPVRLFVVLREEVESESQNARKKIKTTKRIVIYNHNHYLQMCSKDTFTTSYIDTTTTHNRTTQHTKYQHTHTEQRRRQHREVVINHKRRSEIRGQNQPPKQTESLFIASSLKNQLIV